MFIKKRAIVVKFYSKHSLVIVKNTSVQQLFYCFVINNTKFFSTSARNSEFTNLMMCTLSELHSYTGFIHEIKTLSYLKCIITVTENVLLSAKTIVLYQNTFKKNYNNEIVKKLYLRGPFKLLRVFYCSECFALTLSIEVICCKKNYNYNLKNKVNY